MSHHLPIMTFRTYRSNQIRYLPISCKHWGGTCDWVIDDNLIFNPSAIGTPTHTFDRAVIKMSKFEIFTSDCCTPTFTIKRSDALARTCAFTINRAQTSLIRDSLWFAFEIEPSKKINHELPILYWIWFWINESK